MSEEKREYGWGAVDHTGDSGNFIDYLDAARSLEFFQVAKRKGFSLLEIKEGSRVLEVGCGTGDDVLALAQIVGSEGRAVGVDNSETMIAEARKRAEGVNLPVEFRVGDAHRLDLANDTFDACRAERLFEHLEDPKRALAEMVRVARPGARIGVGEPDWETLVVDLPDVALTRTVLNHRCDRHRNGWCGRQLPRLFREAGLAEIFVVPTTFVLTDYAIADRLFGLKSAAEELEEAGELTAGEVARWLEHLENASETGNFFSAVVGFGVRGRKPGAPPARRGEEDRDPAAPCSAIAREAGS